MLKIYFKSTCATCKTALDLIKKNTDEDYELVEYLVDITFTKGDQRNIEDARTKSFRSCTYKRAIVQNEIRRKEIDQCTMDKDPS
jgi:arsenate reductase-like glutaredoxin family protein